MSRRESVFRVTDTRVRLFGGLRQLLEVWYVAAGFKSASRITIQDKDVLVALQKSSVSHGLSFCLSTRKYLIAKDRNQSYFGATIATPISLSDPRKGFFYLYVSKRGSLAELARYLDQRQRESSLGKILGYPECCCNFYAKYLPTANSFGVDLIYYTAEETRTGYPLPWQSNYLARYFDLVLFSHYPCSFICSNTLGMARERWEFISRHNLKLAKHIRDLMRSTMIITSDQGVYAIKRSSFKKATVYFDPLNVLCSPGSKVLFPLLRRSNQLRINSPDCAEVCKGSKVLGSISGSRTKILVFG